MTAPFEETGSFAQSAGEPPHPCPGRRTTRRVVVVGADAEVVALTRRLRAEPLAALTVVGACVPGPAPSAELVEEGIPLGRMEDVLRVLDDVRADAVLAAGSQEGSGTWVRELIHRLRGSGREVLVAADDGAAPDRVVKAVVDRVGAAVLLLLSALVLVLVAVVVRMESPGRVLSRSPRLGQWGRRFDLLGFRTTAPDGALTRTGRFLRRSGVDHLPELVNVLVGDMSLVGPRPEPLLDGLSGDAGTDTWSPVRPGMTGLWYLRGDQADQDGPVGLEYYRRNWSLALDLRILIRTFGASLRGHRTL